MPPSLVATETLSSSAPLAASRRRRWLLVRHPRKAIICFYLLQGWLRLSYSDIFQPFVTLFTRHLSLTSPADRQQQQPALSSSWATTGALLPLVAAEEEEEEEEDTEESQYLYEHDADPVIDYHAPDEENAKEGGGAGDPMRPDFLYSTNNGP